MNNRRHAAPAVPVPIRHTPRPVTHRLRRAIALGCLTVLTFFTTGTAFAVLGLQGNILSTDVDSLLGTARPTVRAGAATDPDPTDPFDGRPLNIVVIGSDTRTGDNSGFSDDGDTAEGMRSDTTILVHVSAERDRLDMVSLPRDLMVDMPVCERSDGTVTGSGLIQFNAAFSYGGQNGDVPSAAACTIKTVELVSQVPVDGYVVVDFAGFRKVIDAIGGVELCIPEAIDAPKADNLVLAAGMQTLDGKTALKYARARTGKGLGGDGSDLTRIKRQQKLLGAVARQTLSSKTLTDPIKLHAVLQAVTKSLTTSKNLGNLVDLTGLAFAMRNLDPKYIAFLTIPVQDYPADTNRVQLIAGVSDKVFESLATDQPIKGTAAYKAAQAAARATSTASPAGGASLAPSTGPTTVEPTPEATTADPTPTTQATEDAASNPFDAVSGEQDTDVCPAG